MSASYIDTHAHYFDRKYEGLEGGAEALLNAESFRAVTRGVINVGTNLQNSRVAVEQAGIFGLFKCFKNAGSGSEYGVDNDLLLAVLCKLALNLNGPILELLEGEVRATDKAKLRLRIGILPNNRVVVLNSLELCIVNDIFACTLCNEFFSELYCLGSEVVDVV